MKGSILLKGCTLLVCLLLMSAPNVFALSYKFDFNGDQSFDSTWNLSNIGSTLNSVLSIIATSTHLRCH